MLPSGLPFCRRLAPGLALALALALENEGEAQAREHARLRFAGTEGLDTCPSEEDLRGAVVARLGYDPFDGDETAPLLRIRFVRRDRRFAALITRGEDGDVSRTVERASCGELLAPVAIAVSIAIDPLASPALPDAPANTVPAPPPVVVPAAGPPAAGDAAAAPSSAPAPASSAWRLRLGLGTHVALGNAPAPSLGLNAGVGGRTGAFSLGVEGRSDLPASTSSANGKVSAQLLAASLLPCLHRGLLAACGVASAGVVLGEGQGGTAPTRGSSPWLGLGARLGIEVPLGDWLFVRVHGELLAAPLRTTLRIGGIDAWTSPVVNAGIGAGLGAFFP